MTLAQFIGVMMFTLLASIAALHLAWGFGVMWPAKNERQLVSWVIGAKNHTRMPSLAQCAAAGTGIFIFGVVALLLSNSLNSPLSPRWVTMIGFLTAIVFAGRGLAGYLPAWRRRFPQQPFATFDQYSFAPLCLLLAAGFALLTYLRINP
jgi:hypothetical protein